MGLLLVMRLGFTIFHACFGGSVLHTLSARVMDVFCNPSNVRLVAQAFVACLLAFVEVYRLVVVGPCWLVAGV